MSLPWTLLASCEQCPTGLPDGRLRRGGVRRPTGCGRHTNRLRVCRPPGDHLRRDPARVETGRRASCPSAATRRMEAAHDWYRVLSAEDRSWVGLVAQAGIAAFIAWLARGATRPRSRPTFRHGAPRADPVDHPAADPRPGALGRRRRRAGRHGAGRTRGGAGAAGVGAALLARDRVRGGRGLRPRRRGPRRLGRPARGTRGRRRAPWRGRRLDAVACRRPRLGLDDAGRRGRRQHAARAVPPASSTACGVLPNGSGWTPWPRSRDVGSSASSATSTTPWLRPARSPTTSATDRSSWDPRCPTCSPPAGRRGRRWPVSPARTRGRGRRVP